MRNGSGPVRWSMESGNGIVEKCSATLNGFDNINLPLSSKYLHSGTGQGYNKNFQKARRDGKNQKGAQK